MQCGFLIIKPQTALYHAVRYIVTCNAVRLCYFADGFGAIFAICAVWWTLLIPTLSCYKKSYFFVVTNCLFWKCYFVRKYNDKSGSWLCTYVCFILVLFNTPKKKIKDFEEFYAAAKSEHQLEAMESREKHQCRHMSCLRRMANSGSCL